jgi:hypothetical protein
MSQAKSAHFQKARKLKVCNVDPNVIYHRIGTYVTFNLMQYNSLLLFEFGGYI